jgi:hypothetical protein
VCRRRAIAIVRVASFIFPARTPGRFESNRVTTYGARLPEPGDGGGEIVAQGTPEDIVKVARSYTGEYLKPVLAREVPAQKKKRIEAAE